MSEELQGLLNKIQAEGLEKAESERARLVAEAKAQADKIIADAKAQADKIRKDAEADAEASRKKADAAVRQAARDVIISLKDDLQEKLRAVVREASAQAMTPEAMAGLIATIAGQFAQNAASGAEIILSAREREDAAQKLIGCLPPSWRRTPPSSSDAVSPPDSRSGSTTPKLSSISATKLSRTSFANSSVPSSPPSSSPDPALPSTPPYGSPK